MRKLLLTLTAVSLLGSPNMLVQADGEKIVLPDWAMPRFQKAFGKEYKVWAGFGEKFKLLELDGDSNPDVVMLVKNVKSGEIKIALSCASDDRFFIVKHKDTGAGDYPDD